MTKKTSVLDERERYLLLAAIAGFLTSMNRKILGLRAVVQIVLNSFFAIGIDLCYQMLININKVQARIG